MRDCLIPNDSVVLREEGESGALLFSPDTRRMLVLNSTGLFIWRLLDGTQTVASLCDAIKKTFTDVPPDTVETDLISFLDDLRDADVVRSVTP